MVVVSADTARIVITCPSCCFTGIDQMLFSGTISKNVMPKAIDTITVTITLLLGDM